MKVILVDDEPIAIDVLKIMLSDYKDINIVATYNDPKEALRDVKKIKPDVIFLDIEMGEMNGLEAADYFIKELNTVEIVFVTAYMEYAIEAFEINAIDYLLKPIQEKRLNKTLERLRENIIEVPYNKDEDEYFKVSSFESFNVTTPKGQSLTWRTKKSKELFAYLWSDRNKTALKSSIYEDVFPDKDMEKVVTLLHTTIYQLRRTLRDLGYPDGIIYEGDRYRLNIAILSDTDQINKISLKKVYKEEDIQIILELYKGDFMEEEGYHWALGLQSKYTETIFLILAEYEKTSCVVKL